MFEKEAFVRLLLARAEGVFSKSYQKMFTEEIFQIRHVKNSFPVTYYLKDLMGYPIEGVVYERELKAVTPPDHYIIEKVLKTEVDKTTGSRRYLVKWKGFPSRFNTWEARQHLLNEGCEESIDEYEQRIANLV